MFTGVLDTSYCHDNASHDFETMGDIGDFLEKWPAHALGRSCAKSNACVVNGRIVSLTEVETKIPNVVPKPKFLDALETKICNDLKNIQSDDRDLRFQAFKGAFQAFIHELKTYKPLLSRIYKEYEDYINFYKAEAQKLRPVKEYLWTISQECDERILKIQKRERPELDNLKREIIRLRDLVSQLREDKISLETQVEHLTQSVKDEHDKFRNEADAKLLLISEINALRMQFDEIEGISKKIPNKTNQHDDPILLKIALEQARKAQSASEFEVVQLKAEYVNVMPKNKYDALLEANNKLKSDYDMKIKENEELNESLELLKNQLHEVMKQRDQSETTVQQLQKVSTPRPEWNEVGRKLPGGLTQWLKETASMSSQEKMHFLANQLTAQNGVNIELNLSSYIKEELNFIPLFLQKSNVDVIVSRPIQLRDCLLLIHELWISRKNEKDTIKMKTPPKSPTNIQHTLRSFDEFLHNFFKQIYGLEQIRIEWAYGFYEMLIKEKNNYKLNELKRIIENKMDEECHWHLESWIKWIKEQIITFIDMNNNNTTSMPTSVKAESEQKIILKQILHEALLNIFNQQDLNNFIILMKSAEEYGSLQIKDASVIPLSSINNNECNDNEKEVNVEDVLDFNKLFNNVCDEDYNPFLKELISLYKQLKTAFINDIISELQKLTSDGVQTSNVTLIQVRHAIESIAPPTAVTSNTGTKSGKPAMIQQQSMPAIDIESSLEWLFKINPNSPPVQSVTLNSLITRLEGCNLFRN
ncbi:Translin-associated factor X-interacting protein isoform 2 [Schistosoma japonicum]|uniref:Translin-associated factor X-interacting protein isoform 2 n=1 Tax=Schistosoma japonicum TaxID=6182 RepID=A0A4Z2CWQ3_SCHJA|nr:Translin-associated factor X-interacting protein isoform 2 [Schistosoma japonicum]